MARPKYLVYKFEGFMERILLDEAIKDMDKIAEMPPQENMDLEKISRGIEFRNDPWRYLVRDIQEDNEINYTCYPLRNGAFKKEPGLK